MGQFTPNLGLYIPSAGETNYTDSFASGMINLDQHDHSGGPNKGVPISSSGLADFSVTYDKLNSNVADPGTGIGVNSTPGLQNQIQALGILKNLFQLAAVPGVGFTSMNGSTVAARTFQNSSSVTWTNPDGVAGNPSAVVNISGISPVLVSNGGTGLTSLTPYAVLAGGTTGTGNVQQVSGLGVATQYLGSNGPGALPTWQTLPATPVQNFQIATLFLSAAQFNAITNSGSTNVVLVPAQGAGKVVVVDSVWGKVTYGGTDAFHGGSSVRLFWGSSSSSEVGFVFTSGSFKDSFTGYYYADNTQSSSSTAITASTMENRNVTVGINTSSFTGGAGNVVSFSCQYSVMQI